MSEETEELCISLVRKTKKIKITGEDGGTKLYTLKEMTGANRDNYVSSQIKKAKIGPDGKPVGITDVDGAQSNLIAKCIYDENDKPIPESVIAQWPASAQTAVFKVCRDMNGMDEESEEKEKNS